jgi:hypothetical protein
MDSSLLFLVLGILAALGLVFYLYMEHQARILRTRVFDVPGGLRFESHGFSMEVQRASKQLVIHSRSGEWTRTPLAGGEDVVKTGALEASVPVSGLQIDIGHGQGLTQPTGHCTITVSASDALAHAAHNLPGGHRSVVKLQGVPGPVALNFSNFAARVRIWVEKLDLRLERDRVERLRKEEEAVQAAEQEQLLAEARANLSTEDALTEQDREALATAQIAKWRKTAGFTGASSEVNIDEEGRVAWFVDLGNDGRITLHADKRTIHTTLMGAEIASMGGELEIGVRDDYWTEEDPALRVFRVFKGLPPDERRAWKERLEMVRDSLRKSASTRA